MRTIFKNTLCSNRFNKFALVYKICIFSFLILVLFFNIGVANASDTSPPILISSYPANGEVNVPVNKLTQSFTFNEEMRSDVSITYWQSTPYTWDINPHIIEWSSDKKTMYITFENNPPTDTTIDWKLNPSTHVNGFRDLAGNLLPYDIYSGSFSTQYNPVERYAMIIGVNTYDYADDLQAPVNDANLMYNLLVNDYGYNPSNIKMVTGVPTSEYSAYVPTRNAIIVLLDEFKNRVDSNDVFIFYFAGHGGRDPDIGKEFIQLKDTETYNSAISDNYLKIVFDEFEGTIISIFDSCNSGGMSYTTDIASPFTYSKNGIDRNAALVLMASKADESAWDDNWHGLFTFNFHKAFTSDRYISDNNPRNGMVSIEEGFAYAKSKVTTSTPQIMDNFQTKYANKNSLYFSEIPINQEFISGEADCPIHLHAYDSEGRHTGINDDDSIEEGIPKSFYNGPDYDSEEIIVLGKSDNIQFKIDSLDEGFFTFKITQSTDEGIIRITYSDIPISKDTTAIIDVNAENSEYIIKIDNDDDGNIDAIKEPDSLVLLEVIQATIDIEPDTLNYQNKGKWFTIFIELPEGQDVNNIDTSSVLLNGQIQAEDKPTEISDYDKDGIADLMMKFNRSKMQEILEVGDEVEITVTGEFTDGIVFEGTDMIRVIALK